MPSKSGSGGGTKDPLEHVNRVSYKINRTLDAYLFRPIAKSYVEVTPEPVQSHVHNFFTNLGEPVTVANDMLQGKARQFMQDLGRFVINSTFGLAGFFDIGSDIGLVHHDEDLGQTLAVWGVPSGPYLVVPLLGPSTLRDAPTRYGDTYVSPLYYYDNVAVRNDIVGTRLVDLRAQLLPVDKQLQQAYDPYSFERDAYLQHRRFLIYDGHPPIQYPSYPELPGEKSGNSSHGK
jgi:phospholipid-binding lipoprotein MlaA